MDPSTLFPTNKDLCEIFCRSKEKTTDILVNYLIHRFDIDESFAKSIDLRLKKYFMPIFKAKFKSAFYSADKLLSAKKNQDWLNNNFIISCNTNSVLGRKKKVDFQSLSEKTKRRRSDDLINSLSPEEIEHLFFEMLKAEGKKHIIKTIKNILSSESPSEIEINPNSPIALTNDEAVALSLDANLTKVEYNLIRLKAKAKNADIFPHYLSVVEAKKNCYPISSSIHISESFAWLELQDLLNQTTERLFQTLVIDAKTFIKNNFEKIILVSKWGGDGTSGLNEWKQKSLENIENKTDKYLFFISLVPLQLKAALKDGTQQIFWENPRPSSTNYCRPVKIEFVQETKSKVIEEFKNIEAKINNLYPTNINISGEELNVHHVMHCTMIDGKIRQYITGTSSASVCPICKASPKEMNNLSQIRLRNIDRTVFDLGLSSLHQWIRSMECVLHIAYRLNIQKWAVRSDSDKQSVQERKHEIQTKLKQNLGINVDVVKQGSGTTNDGNCARTFFENYEAVSEITSFDAELLKRMYILLQVIASGRYVDVSKFREYANHTADIYIETYPWFYMPVALHIMLLHGADIIGNFDIPIGYMSEEPQESDNKIIKRTRVHHTRKTSRKDTIEDLVHYLLLISDPYITSMRNIQKKSIKLLHDEAMLLLSEQKQKSELNHKSES